MKKTSPTENMRPFMRLINLIKLMSQSQKRDFKKHSRFWGKSDTKHILLFDTINKHLLLGHSDDMIKDMQRKVRHKIKDINTISTYLYNKILESMRLTPEKESYYNKINGLFQDIAFLYNKSLIDDCQLLVKEAKVLSYKLDKPVYVLESLFWERRIEEYLNLKGVSAKLKSISREESRVIKDLNTFVNHNALLSRLAISFRREIAITEEIEHSMSSLISMYKESKHEIISPRIKIKILYSIVIYRYINYNSPHTFDTEINNNLEEAMHCLHEIIEIYDDEKNDILKGEEMANYYQTVDHYINIAIKLGKSKDLEKLRRKYSGRKGNTSVERSINAFNLLDYIKNNKFIEAKAYIENSNLEIVLTQNKGQIPKHILLTLKYSCGQIYFILEDYAKSFSWFERVIVETRNDNRPEIGDLARILNHISLFEIGRYNNDERKHLIFDLMKKRILSEKNEEEEKKILNLFKMDLINALLTVMIGNEDVVNKLPFDSIKHNVLNTSYLQMYGIITAWIESKVNKSTVIEEVKKYIK